MNAMPQSVEASLLEAGFSSTEILILRRLLDDDALTLREMATKSGKSTGVLDQAMKKLMRKDIVVRETINGVEKYVIPSLEAVLRWMDEDVRRKRDMLSRRHENFETFLRTLEKDKKKPNIEYFNGLEGIAQAYRKIIEQGKEILGYVPVFCAIEEHPLRDFMVEWFRMRRKKGAFTRITAHDTPFGRRHQSRDPFEYRQTILLDAEQYPFTYEKYICGDTVTCINYAEKSACILKYPELAAMEASLFEGIWRQGVKERNTPVPEKSAQPMETPVPATVRALKNGSYYFFGRFNK